MKYCLFLALAILALAIPCLAADGKPIDKPVMLEDLAITPLPPHPVALESKAGSYERSIMKPAPLFKGTPDPFAGVTAFQGRDSTSPPVSSKDAAVGEGQGGRFTGGGVAEWKDAVRRGPTLLIIIGGLMLAAGIIVAIWAGRWVLGLAVAGAGLALAMTGVLFEMYPWVVLIALAAVLGLAIWWFIDAKGLLKVKTALTAVVGAVEANPEVKVAVGDAAAALNAESTIRATVRKTKNTAAAKTAEKAAADAAKVRAAETTNGTNGKVQP